MTAEKRYKGVIIPMVTPLNQDFTIDKEAVGKILQSFANTGVQPFLLGTTGESVSFSMQQKLELVNTTMSINNEPKNVYVGISGNSLLDSIEEAKKYCDLGVETVVAHLPFYYPITPAAMLKYYEQLADSVPCPLFLYNNPITTNISIPLEVADQLSHHPNIVGLKDSERGEERLDQSIILWKNREDFSHLLGWAAKSAYAILNGSDGIVPSTGNLTPGLYKELYDAAGNGDRTKAYELQDKTDKISSIYQKNRKLDTSLSALKLMMSEYDLCQTYVMPPMYPLSDIETEKIKNAMVNEMVNLG